MILRRRTGEPLSLPASRQLLPAGWRARKRGPSGGPEAVETEGQIAMTQLVGAGPVAKPDARQLFEQEGDVVDGGVGTECAGGSGALEETFIELLCARSFAIEVLGGLEGSGQPHRQGAAVRIDRTAHEANERLPGIALISQRFLDRRDVAREAVGAETAQEVLLAGVPAVERADSHAGAFGHGTDRRLRVRDEDLVRRLQDALVVASRLGSTTAQGNGGIAHDTIVSERTAPFCYAEENRLFRSEKWRLTMDWKLELVAVPVSDVDAAKEFYTEKVGFTLDHDHRVSETMRFVQITPPGSACSIAIGEGITDAAPGSAPNLQVVVSSVQEARDQLVASGVEVSPIQEFPWGSFVFFQDPDGNRWAVQQLPLRH